MRGVRATQAGLALTFAAVAACLVVGIVVSDRRAVRPTSLEGENLAAGPQDVNVHLRASSDLLAWSCGGKEVADVCLLSTETCVQVHNFSPSH